MRTHAANAYRPYRQHMLFADGVPTRTYRRSNSSSLTRQAMSSWNIAILVVLSLVSLLSGCSSTGAPGADSASGDAESQREADKVVTQYIDNLMYELPPPKSSTAATIDAVVPAVLPGWRSTITRELVSATGRPPNRQLLVRITVDWVPSNTSDWQQPSEARVSRCFVASSDATDADGPGGSADWLYVESECDSA